MSDLGTIGTLAETTDVVRIFQPSFVRCIQADGEYMVMGRINNSEGNPDPPSLEVIAKGVRRMRWNVQPGTRAIQVDVKQQANLSPRPTLVVRANPAIGVDADVTGTAASGADWVTIGPINITPDTAGAVWVELRNNLDTQLGSTPCLWQHVDWA